MENMNQAIKVTFLLLLVAAVTGVFMRALPLFPVAGISFDYLRHAHSHLAFLGWVYPSFFLAFVQWFLPAGSFEQARYRQLYWWGQGSAAGMFIAFLMGGYGPVSIALLTVHTLVAYFFMTWFIRDLVRFARGIPPFGEKPAWRDALRNVSVAGWYAVAALLSFFISSLGPFAIPVIQVAGNGSPLWLKTAVGFYLHFQCNGWFVLGLLALFVRAMEIGKVSFSGKMAGWLLGVLVISLVPMFFANLTFFEFSPTADRAILVAAFFQWAMLTFFGGHIFKKNRLAPLFSGSWQRCFLFFSLAALWLKMACQLLAVLPGAALFFDLRNHFLTLGYLHLLFLGAVTPMLFYFFSRENEAAWNKRLASVGSAMFLLGLAGSELLLFLAGLGFVVPDLATWLLLFSGALLAGIAVFSNVQKISSES